MIRASSNIVIPAVTIDDREALLRCLEDGAPEYAELRATLLNEHVWRDREGLN